MSLDLMREAIVDEARTWLRTPYHHLGGLKGVGVDCAMLLVRVYQACGIVPQSFDPRPYEPEWYLHQDEERFLMGLEQWSRPIEIARVQPGDIALYRFGKTAAHGAIVIDDQSIIHAYKLHGNVELCEMRSLVDKSGRSRLDSCWSVIG